MTWLRVRRSVWRSGSVRLVGRRLPGLVLPFGERVGGPSLPGTQDVGRGVDRDARQPAPERLAAEPGQVAVGAEERLLHRIRCRFPVVDHTERDREQIVLMELDQAVESVEVAPRACSTRARSRARSASSVRAAGGAAGSGAVVASGGWVTAWASAPSGGPSVGIGLGRPPERPDRRPYGGSGTSTGGLPRRAESSIGRDRDRARRSGGAIENRLALRCGAMACSMPTRSSASTASGRGTTWEAAPPSHRSPRRASLRARLRREPKWRNRQTRRSQKPLRATSSGFDPRLRHHDSRSGSTLGLGSFVLRLTRSGRNPGAIGVHWWTSATAPGC